MLPVEKIEALVDENQNLQAHAALDEILSLGPNNFGALKLRARLFRDSGRFLDESKTWQKIAVIDTDDEDYIKFLATRKRDEREYIFFTQDISTEGRRFLTLSKSVLHSALFGLMGSMVFLSYSHVAQIYTQFLTLFNLLASFGLLVIVPWVWIVKCFFWTLRSITMNDDKIIFRSYVKTHIIDAKNLHSVEVKFDHKDRLSLVFSPLIGSKICIDFRDYYSPIRSRSFFLRDLQKYHHPVIFTPERSTQRFKGIRFS